MSDAVNHPTPQDLTAFVLGLLPPRVAITVAAHLQSCLDCRNAVANLSPDSLIGKVPSSPNRPGVPPAGSQEIPPELARHPKFLILRELGRGGMGVVYQARHKGMDRQVVIKVINQTLLGQPGALERFHREVRAAAQLSHPNIVTAYDAEQAGDLHILVMEFVPGQSLAEVLQKKGPQPVAHSCYYIRQVALGLQHAHERDMIHRDIKPSNLILTPKGKVKILDFGLAKVLREGGTGTGLTPSDDFMGTPEYCAPEQTTDARGADIRADLYSLGCTLYCLLAGRPPFQEDTAMKTILAHLQKPPQPLPELRSDVSVRLWEVVARLLAKDPGQRYQVPIEVAHALAPFAKPGAKADAKDDPAPSTDVDSTSKRGGDSLPPVRVPIVYFPCPYCGNNVKAPAGAAGRACRCPRCRHLMEVPVVFQGEAPPIRSALRRLPARVIIDVEPEPKVGLPVPFRPVHRDLSEEPTEDVSYGPPALVTPEWESPVCPNKIRPLAVSVALIAGLFLVVLFLIALAANGQNKPTFARKIRPPIEPDQERIVKVEPEDLIAPIKHEQWMNQGAKPVPPPDFKPNADLVEPGAARPPDNLENHDLKPKTLPVTKKTGPEAVQEDNQEALKRQTKEKLDNHIKNLKRGKGAERIHAAKAIGEMGAEAKDARRALCDSLLDPRDPAFAEILDALKKVDPLLHNPVSFLVLDKDPAILLGALQSLAKLGEEGNAAHFLLLERGIIAARVEVGELATLGDLKIGVEMIRTLAAIAPKEKEVLTALIKCLIYSKKEVAKLVAAEGLARTTLKKDAAEALIISLQRDPSDNVRAAAAKALGELGPDAKGAVTALEQATLEASSKVRAEAETALRRIKEKR